MLYLIISRTRSGLSEDDMKQLADAAKNFYGNIPAGLALTGNWAETNGARTFALLETENPDLLENIQAPFRPFVDMEVISLVNVEGWRDQ